MTLFDTVLLIILVPEEYSDLDEPAVYTCKLHINVSIVYTITTHHVRPTGAGIMSEHSALCVQVSGSHVLMEASTVVLFTLPPL